MTCGDIKERLVDHLYGEMDEAAARAFEAHLGGCASCRQEVEALGATLSRTRAAVRSSLEEPPPRVRAAVLVAAAAARPAAVAPTPEVSFLARLLGWLRRPYVVPAFAAASAMAIFIFARRTIFDSAREVPHLSAPAAQPEEAEIQLPRSPAVAPAAEPAPAAETARVAQPVAAPPAKPRRHVRVASRPALSPPAPAPKRAMADDLLDSMTLDGSPRPAGGAAAPSAGARRFAAPPAPSAPEAKAREKRDEVIAGTTSSNRTADRAGAPTRQREARQDAESQARPQMAKKLKAEEPAERGHFDNRLAAGTAAAPPPPAAAPAPQATAAAPNRRAALMDDAPADRGLSLEELLRRGDRAFGEHRWSEAALAYRELLRRFPGHRDRARWKGRLADCERALTR